MQNQLLNRKHNAVGAALSACNTSPFLQPAHTKGLQKIRIALPAAPRPQLCAMDRSLRREMRTAELAFWEATGGDYLKSSLATNFKRNF